MRYRPFARTGLRVSEICLGTMTFGGQGFWKAMGDLQASAVEELVGAALDAGVNLLDTADVYAEGESERLLGGALRALGRPRDSYLLATKVRGRTGPGPNDVGLSRGHILASIDGSLRRLGVDHVDLYQVHGVDVATPLEETVRALEDTIRAGKVRYVGFSNFPAWQAMKALGIADALGASRFVSAQMYYSIAGRDIEREVVPLAQSEQLALLPWSPLAGGLLSGKFDARKQGPAGARRSGFDFPPVDEGRLPAVLDALRTVADGRGISVARVALAWVLSRPFVTSVIIGAKSRAQLDDNLAATEVTLTDAERALLDDASTLPSEYPAWMVARQNADR